MVLSISYVDLATEASENVSKRDATIVQIEMPHNICVRPMA
jgi:hypothetical protein